MSKMEKMVAFSTDIETIEKLEELAQILKKKKSQLFREFVSYFYKHKDNLSNGIQIIEV